MGPGHLEITKDEPEDGPQPDNVPKTQMLPEQSNTTESADATPDKGCNDPAFDTELPLMDPQ